MGYTIRAFAVTLVLASAAHALPPPATSLNTCQNTIRNEAKKFVKNYVDAVGICLQKVSTEIVQKNAANANAAAGTCVTQFRKINDTRGLFKSLADKLQKAIEKKCVPGGNNTHTLQDILGTGAGVLQPLNAEDLGLWCTNFGGGGTVASLNDVITCIRTAGECEARQTVATHYPRGLEWLDLVRTPMNATVPPLMDPTRTSDAVAALDAVNGAIDGPDNDNLPSLQCGSKAFAASGQTTCWDDGGAVTACAGTGHDGDKLAGAPLAYIDNVDGTITDVNTRLIWEKLSDDGSIHDWDDMYTWSDAVAVKIAGLNTASFAGHSDWRMPNVRELQSIVNYENSLPAVSPVFNTLCAPTCTIPTCSCTQSGGYWSSSSIADGPTGAWGVGFDGGGVGGDSKANTHYVRAVRGGS